MKITLLTGKMFDLNDELDFELKIVFSAKAKRLGLRIDSKNRIPVLTVPKRCGKQQALAFVKSQKKWIDEHLAKLPLQKFFSDGDKISIGGKEFLIRHCPEQYFGVQVEGENLLVSGEKDFLSRRVKDFIKKQAQKVLWEMSEAKAALIEKKVNRVVIKDTKSRWGSCSSLGNINYSWRIMLAPDFVIDYLVAHETAHLKHQDHSPAFWQCVDVLAKNAADGRKWLKENGSKLNVYI